MNTENQTEGQPQVATTALVRPLPKDGVTDCPAYGGEKTVARHNADWTCHEYGLHEVTDPDREALRRIDAMVSVGVGFKVNSVDGPNGGAERRPDMKEEKS